MASHKKVKKAKATGRKKSVTLIEDKKIHKIAMELMKVNHGFEKIIKSCKNVAVTLKKENGILP